MRPSLDDIMNTTLSVLNIETSEWEAYRKSRQSFIVRAKELFCLLSFEEGYTHQEIATAIGLHRSTVIHHINAFKAHCDLYPSCYRLIERSQKLLEPSRKNRQKHSYSSGWLARSASGLLTISPVRPERFAGYWVAEGSRPFDPQGAFPQVTYETGPIRVLIKVTMEEDEKM